MDWPWSDLDDQVFNCQVHVYAAGGWSTVRRVALRSKEKITKTCHLDEEKHTSSSCHFILHHRQKLQDYHTTRQHPTNKPHLKINRRCTRNLIFLEWSHHGSPEAVVKKKTPSQLGGIGVCPSYCWWRVNDAIGRLTLFTAYRQSSKPRFINYRMKSSLI